MKEASMDPAAMYMLPLELIIQILLRLPVKSLIRFKCVCKSWLSLISNDTHFALSHFQLTSSTATLTCRIMFITPIPYRHRHCHCLSIDFEASLKDDSSYASSNIYFMYPHDLQFKVSCRGFLLLHGSFDIYIWNPSTGFHKQLPLSRYGSSYRNYFYGFGYEESTDDYLLVSISHDPKLANTKHLEIFSLRDNTWKEIEGIHCPYTNSSTDYPKIIGSLFNGAIHWFSFRHDHLQMDLILAFDLIKRELFEIPLPIDIDYEATNCDVWVFGQFLSIWAMDYDNDTVEIWVMKEYKVHSSWG
ncbi:putative F-box domain, galactose oxidase/kelch, beta-propeller, F-box associated interaction [Medicago truncatula]|uniref:Putative F-box domain, galactose oxidase/kelch, beta-propeller, F-box associated interaction n=1 Tax=Medicago truncatula TaxID=3880 RepID=A0A396HIQ7_MEDTR|nr:putative F-box domain, galactose oxidase/kelch, beta-propeller, F-box associated interaction [Medicago truncatula]